MTIFSWTWHKGLYCIMFTWFICLYPRKRISLCYTCSNTVKGSVRVKKIKQKNTMGWGLSVGQHTTLNRVKRKTAKPIKNASKRGPKHGNFSVAVKDGISHVSFIRYTHWPLFRTFQKVSKPQSQRLFWNRIFYGLLPRRIVFIRTEGTWRFRGFTIDSIGNPGYL